MIRPALRARRGATPNDSRALDGEPNSERRIRRFPMRSEDPASCGNSARHTEWVSSLLRRAEKGSSKSRQASEDLPPIYARTVPPHERAREILILSQKFLPFLKETCQLPTRSVLKYAGRRGWRGGTENDGRGSGGFGGRRTARNSLRVPAGAGATLRVLSVALLGADVQIREIQRVSRFI